MRVRDAMTSSPAACEPTTMLRSVAQLMLERHCTAIPVTHDGRLVGIVTDRDICTRAVAANDDAPRMPARAFMSSPVIAVNPDDDVQRAAAMMSENAIRHLPVIDDEGMLVGMISQSDLGRRMTNREFGQLARDTSVRTKFPYRHGGDAIARREH